MSDATDNQKLEAMSRLQAQDGMLRLIQERDALKAENEKLKAERTVRNAPKSDDSAPILTEQSDFSERLEVHLERVNAEIKRIKKWERSGFIHGRKMNV